jgi:hydroxyethylthiazole kinase-like uncharacterized protein yjeF
MKIATIAEMREMDGKAIDEYGIPEHILMENAGEAAYYVILNEFGVRHKKFIVFCGSGNNGGDGFVVARKLHSNGAEVKVFLLSKRDKFQGSAEKNLEILSHLPVEIKEIKSTKRLRVDILHTDAIVDAIFGTGIDRNIEGIYREVIDLINTSNKTVFAVDIASGINGDSGQEMGTSVQADYTITFGLPKIGNLLYPGFGRGGKLFTSHISFPPSLYNSDELKAEIAHPLPLPVRAASTSKMDYGPVLVIAGAANYFWAPHASAYSVLKAGGGYVYLACPRSIAASVSQSGKEVVFVPQEETNAGSIALINQDFLLELASRMKMVILGPGLSLNEETQSLVRELVKEIDRPLLIDGDGITAVAHDIESIKERSEATILTPHPGEMARICGIEREEIEKNQVRVLQDVTEKINAIIVLKGAHSLIGYPDRSVFINVTGATGGQAGMATAGSGDVLNGTIAAMYCLGLPVEEAVRTGVFVHGLAGDMAAEEKGPDGMTAQDTMDYLPYAVQYYRENLSEISENFYDTVHFV